MLRILSVAVAAISPCLVGCAARTESKAQTAEIQLRFVDVQDSAVEKIAPLIDPAKLDTLKGDRAANPRLWEICYWLLRAEETNPDIGTVIDNAQRKNGDYGTPRARETKMALIRNVTMLKRLGCDNLVAMERMRHGKAPTIARGP